MTAKKIIFIGIFFFSLLIIFRLSIFVLFEASLLFETDLLPGYDREYAYEQLRRTSGNGDIGLLEKDTIPGYEAQVQELIGDSLYVRGALTGEILSWYQKSRESAENPRIIKKIEILSGTGGPGKEESISNPKPPPPQSTLTEGAYSGRHEELEEAKSRVLGDNAQRSLYLQESLEKYGKIDIINFTQYSIERVDW